MRRAAPVVAALVAFPLGLLAGWCGSRPAPGPAGLTVSPGQRIKVVPADGPILNLTPVGMVTNGPGGHVGDPGRRDHWQILFATPDGRNQTTVFAELSR